MGTSRFDASAYATYSSTTIASKSTREIFTASRIKNEFDPKNITIRESRDSNVNPESTPIIIGLDVTGSMGMVLDAMIRGVGTLMTEIYDKKPVSDPHVMFMGIGDVAAGDKAPLQVTQFEADIRIAEQLKDVYIERGGGGNDSESYTLPWYFAGMRTKIDSHTERGKKGYIFTVGDECVPATLTSDQLGHIGLHDQQTYTARELYNLASQKYDIFHIMIEEGNYMRSRRDKVVESWTDLIGQNAIALDDHTKLPELIISTIMRNEGLDDDAIMAAWSGNAAVSASVRRSLNINLRNI